MIDSLLNIFGSKSLSLGPHGVDSKLMSKELISLFKLFLIFSQQKSQQICHLRFPSEAVVFQVSGLAFCQTELISND